jgi:hypothetical protein
MYVNNYNSDPTLCGNVIEDKIFLSYLMQNKKFIISSDDLFSIVTTLYVARFVIYTLIDNFVVKILYQDIHIDVRKIVLNVFK